MDLQQHYIFGRLKKVEDFNYFRWIGRLDFFGRMPSLIFQLKKKHSWHSSKKMSIALVAIEQIIKVRSALAEASALGGGASGVRLFYITSL